MDNEIKVNLKAEIVNRDKIKKQIENLKEELNNIQIRIVLGNEESKKKFKTRDELLEIYENVEINQEQLDEK